MTERRAPHVCRFRRIRSARGGPRSANGAGIAGIAGVAGEREGTARGVPCTAG
ncbi:conserved hypothetical protein, partial [Burkholderia mallei GB8 horse 4]